MGLGSIPLGHFETRYFRDYVWIVGHIGWDYQTALEGFLPWIEQGSLFLLHSARYLPEKSCPTGRICFGGSGSEGYGESFSLDITSDIQDVMF